MALMITMELLKTTQKAIELNPEFVIAYYNRGTAKYYLKDYQGAINDLKKTIELDPKYTEAYN